MNSPNVKNSRDALAPKHRLAGIVHRLRHHTESEEHEESSQGSAISPKKIINNFVRKEASFHKVCADTNGAILSAMSKHADSGGVSVIEEPADASRKRRLAELLKKREHTETASGSASPNPPKGC